MAQIEIPKGANVVWILEQAGHPIGIDSSAGVEGNLLIGPDCTQEALDNAFASYDHEAYIVEQKELRDAKVSREEASKAVIALAPEWKQRNLLAKALVLMATHLGIIDSPEAAEMVELWSKIDKIREDSNKKEDTSE
jgi:hypothetical protein